MRTQYLTTLKVFFYDRLLPRRNVMEISQEEMAHRLMMAPRSYIELEHGNTCCGALTLALYLIYICEDPMSFLVELRYAFENSDSKVV